MSSITQNLLKFVNVQMAAEAIFPTGFSTGAIPLLTLTDGNGRASKFTPTEAAEFAKDWQVVEHKANTETGFSGTLFKYTGAADAARGLTNGELVMSFRSTEFIDDAARDNEATNTLEIKEYGWAFGQIADMQSWYAALQGSGKISGPLSVTGYSLGGHLATAFMLLNPSAVAGTYTFNGAGVGSVTGGKNLTNVIANFKAHRGTGANADLFTDTAVKAVYDSLIATFKSGANVSLSQATAALGQVTDLLLTSPESPHEQIDLLRQAVERIKMVVAEAERVPLLQSGGEGGPAGNVSTSHIDAATLDYQLAVLRAGVDTDAHHTSVPLGGWNAVFGRNIAPGGSIANFYDIFGANPPSAVSNSQYHYGTAMPVFIEDQPLWRGNVVLDAAIESLSNAEAKLLVNNFSNNDFGDTHSLVLLVDSLTVQSALSRLSPSISQQALDAILQSASNARAAEGGQGLAEGNVLENVVNVLGKAFGMAWATSSPLKGNNTGGTWAAINDGEGTTGRETLHARLKEIIDSPAVKLLEGQLLIRPASSDLKAAARNDFGALVALQDLSPLWITGKTAAADAQLASAWQSVRTSDYTAWLADKSGDAPSTFTDSWLADRADMLGAQVLRNTLNTDVAVGKTNIDYVDLAGATIVQRVSGAGTGAPASKVVFGTDGNNVLVGADNAQGDHLYGMAGNDVLDGKGGNDYLEGGTGVDTYVFTGAWGKDTVMDSDGRGVVQIDDTALAGSFEGTGTRDGYAFNMGGGEYAGLYIAKDAQSTTGYKATVVKGTDSANSITINNFDLTKAKAGGYLGIQIAGPKLALVQGGGANYWHDPSASLASLSGKTATVNEGGGASFCLSLSTGAKSGDTITLSFSGASGCKVILGDSTVNADGAVITLTEGQTDVRFALVHEGELDANALASLSGSYNGSGGSATSNAWGVRHAHYPHQHARRDGTGGGHRGAVFRYRRQGQPQERHNAGQFRPGNTSQKKRQLPI